MLHGKNMCKWYELEKKYLTTRKQQGFWGKKSSECRRNIVIPTTYRQNKSSEIIPRNFFFRRKSLGIFRRNSEETNFRGNSEDHYFVGNVLGIYRGRTSSGYFLGRSSIDAFLDIYTSIDRNIPTDMFLGIFRGTCPSVYSEERCPSVYSEEDVPRYIPNVFL